MSEQFYNNGGSDSSIFQARIREEDLAAEEKINEIVRAADKLIRDAILQNQSHEQINQQIQSELDGLLDRVESCVKESDTESDEGILQKIYECLKNFFDAFGISVKEPNLENYLLKLKKEKDKNWLFSIIKELCDKLRKLLSRVFKENLSWDEALEQEIKKLQEKLDSGDLSKEETLAVLERLEALRAMKLKFQMAFASLVLTSFFTFLEVNLSAAQAQETSTEENKKIGSKEPEVKQAKENAEGEVKTSENKELKSVIQVAGTGIQESLRNPKGIENEEKKPIIPFKPELDLLNLLGNLKPEKFIEPRREAQEKPKQAAAAPTPPPAAPQPPAPVKAPEVKPVQRFYTTPRFANREKRDYGKSDQATSNIREEKAQITKSINEKEIDDLCTEFLTQLSCAEGKPDMSKQDVGKSDLTNGKVRSELNAIKGVESAVDVNCGRVM